MCDLFVKTPKMGGSGREGLLQDRWLSGLLLFTSTTVSDKFYIRQSTPPSICQQNNSCSKQYLPL